MAKKDTHTHQTAKLTSTLAREGNGNIQITFTISEEEVRTLQNHVAEEVKDTVTVSGFRKGKAPVSKVLESMSEESLAEKTVNHIYPNLIKEIIETHKLKPAMYPKIELLKTPRGGQWQIRAIVAELPEIKVADYKKLVTAEKGKKELKKEEKEALVIKALLTKFKVAMPKILLEEEVNQRLTALLARIEKLGLSLDSYLSSIGKDAKGLREEYERQAAETINLQLILNEIARQEKVEVKAKEVEEAAKAAGIKDSAGQKEYITAVLKRRKALELLTALV